MKHLRSRWPFMSWTSDPIEDNGELYKPVPSLRGINRLDEMRRRYEEVLRALKAFDEEFENSVRLSRERAR